MTTAEDIKRIIASAGGKENIVSLTHCVTRLRFTLNDKEKIKKELLEEVKIVKGSFFSNNQYQIIVGPELVEKSCQEVKKELNLLENENIKTENKKTNFSLKDSIKILADVFIPILPAIVAGGLLLGINGILTAPNIFSSLSLTDMYPSIKDIAEFINMIASTAFAFLPVLVGYSASKRFGGNPILGILLGLILIHPSLMSAYQLSQNTPENWNIFGMTINKVGYQGQILPVLVSAYVLSKLEINLKKIIPGSIHLILIGPLVLLITCFFTFLILGPVTYSIANKLTIGIIWLFKSFPILAGFIIGGLFEILVITGMHHTLLAVNLELIASTGGTFLFPIIALSCLSQGSACLAMGLFSKSKNEKSMALVSTLSAYLGVTEPAIFGINLKYRYPFICGLIGTGLSGAF